MRERFWQEVIWVSRCLYTKWENTKKMDKKTIISLLGKFDKKQLQELIVYIVNADESAKELLLDYCQKKAADVNTDNHTLIIESKMRQYWKKAAQIIEEFDMYGGGPEADEDVAYTALEEMAKLLEDNEVSWIVRKEILDEMLGFVSSDNSGFTDYLMDIAVIMCINRQESIYLADFLIENANSYYRGLAAKIYLENGEEQKFIESKKANLHYGSDYLELAAYYKKHNDMETALKIVLEGLDKADGRLDGIYEYLFRYYEKNGNEVALEKLYAQSAKRNRNQDTITELMHEYYQKKGYYENQKGTLLKLLSCCDTRELYKLYQKCRQELSNEDFRKEDPAILDMIKKRNLSAYFDILMDKGGKKEVIAYITQHQQYRGWGLDEGHYFSKRLAGEYPREVVDMYWKEIAFYVSLGKGKNYARAVEVLKEIRTIMKRNKWTEEWDIKYSTFLEEHKKKIIIKGIGTYESIIDKFRKRVVKQWRI